MRQQLTTTRGGEGQGENWSSMLARSSAQHIIYAHARQDQEKLWFDCATTSNSHFVKLAAVQREVAYFGLGSGGGGVRQGRGGEESRGWCDAPVSFGWEESNRSELGKSSSCQSLLCVVPRPGLSGRGPWKSRSEAMKLLQQAC